MRRCGERRRSASSGDQVAALPGHPSREGRAGQGEVLRQLIPGDRADRVGVPGMLGPDTCERRAVDGRDDATGLDRIDLAAGREHVDPLVDAHGQPADVGVPDARGRAQHRRRRHPGGTGSRLEFGVLAVEIRLVERRLHREASPRGDELLHLPLLAPLDPAREPGVAAEAEGAGDVGGAARVRRHALVSSRRWSRS